MKVLAVDDDEMVLSILEDTLSSAGYTVILASNGKDAFEILKQGDIRLVITDWSMPEIDGINLCQLIRHKYFSGYVYIILLTSRVQKKDIQDGLMAGADDYITKPFDLTELKLRVQIGERILSAKIQNITVFAMAKLAESRDPETGFHLERIRRYCWFILQELKKTEKYINLITDEYSDNLYLASSLHDIGKVCIPDNILLKPGSLNEEEWLMMKTHSAKGAEVMQDILEHYPGMVFLEIARDITLSHHEKYDGSGYPKGLKGENIPLAARIVALADVYDAMTNKRVYKKAFTHEKTRSYIVENSGKHFDPDIVKAFLDSEKMFIKTQKELSDSKQLPTQKEKILKKIRDGRRSH